MPRLGSPSDNESKAVFDGLDGKGIARFINPGQTKSIEEDIPEVSASIASASDVQRPVETGLRSRLRTALTVCLTGLGFGAGYAAHREQTKFDGIEHHDIRYKKAMDSGDHGRVMSALHDKAAFEATAHDARAELVSKFLTIQAQGNQFDPGKAFSVAVEGIEKIKKDRDMTPERVRGLSRSALDALDNLVHAATKKQQDIQHLVVAYQTIIRDWEQMENANDAAAVEAMLHRILSSMDALHSEDTFRLQSPGVQQWIDATRNDRMKRLFGDSVPTVVADKKPM